MVRKNKKKFSLKEQYKLSLKYLKESDSYIALVFGFFIFFFALGMVFPFIVPQDVLNVILEKVSVWIEDILAQTEGKGFFEMWWFIFQNNISISFISIFSGVFFGIIPALFVLSNGFFIGLITGIISSFAGVSVFFKLLPHGVFEIPAIIISFALGIKMGSFIFHKNRKKALKHLFNNSIRVFVFIVLPLLIIASFIEALLIIRVG